MKIVTIKVVSTTYNNLNEEPIEGKTFTAVASQDLAWFYVHNTDIEAQRCALTIHPETQQYWLFNADNVEVQEYIA